MLDGRYLRDNLDAVRTALGARAGGWDFERFVSLDDERRRLIGEVESRQAFRNDASGNIGELMKAGQRDEAEAAKEQVRVINEEIAGLDGGLAQIEADLREMLLTIPNVPDPSVPVGADENDNVEIRRVGTPPAFGFEPISDVRTCERVNAPAVLLRLDVSRLEGRMREAGALTPGQLTLARG